MINADAFRKNIEMLWEECGFANDAPMDSSPFLHVNARNSAESDYLDNMDDETFARMTANGWNMEFLNNASGYSAITALDNELLFPDKIPAGRKDELHYFINHSLSYLTGYVAWEVREGISKKEEYSPEIFEIAEKHDFYNLLPYDRALNIFNSLMESDNRERENTENDSSDYFGSFLERWETDPQSSDLVLARGFALEQNEDGDDIIVYRTWQVDGDDMTVKQQIGTVSEKTFNNPELFKKIILDNPQIPNENLRRSWSYRLDETAPLYFG